jgi:hypothetical protein
VSATVLIAWLFFSIVFASLCGYIGFMKGHPFVLGAALGFVFGCIGLVIVAVMPRKTRPPVPELRLPPSSYRASDAPLVPTSQPWVGPVDTPAWVDPRTQPVVERVAGWYDDPYGIYTYRYWDGDDWTDHTSNGS